MSIVGKTLISFDTETTGLIKPEVVDINDQPEIIELYMVKHIVQEDLSLKKIDEIDTFLKPRKEFTDEITRITGITNEMVADAPTFLQMFPIIQKFHVGADAWVAHNCAFDSAMMANEVSRIGKVIHFPFPPEHICTVRKTMHIEQRRMTLKNLHKELLGWDFEDAHRARNDVEAMVRCLEVIIKKGWV